MNLLNANRKVRHSRDTVENLEARRAKAKDKSQWDKLYVDALALAKAQLRRDMADMSAVLKAEGYFRWVE